MREGTSRSRRIRIIAAVCAVVIAAGGSAGVYAFRRNTNAKAAPAETTSANTQTAAGDSIISAGGTVESSQLADSLGLENTAVRLSVEKVLVEQGEAVTAGTPLYQITSDSLAKAGKTLDSELQTARSELLEQNMSYQTDKNEAYLLYQSELMLGETAQSEYDSGIASLDNALAKAKESYQEALDTINSVPAEINAKQAELDKTQSSVNSLFEKKKTAQSKADTAKEGYSSAVSSYNSAVNEYNSAASVARYLGKALGRDVSAIGEAKTVTADTQKDVSVPQNDDPKDENVPVMDGGEPSFDMRSDKDFISSPVQNYESAPPEKNTSEKSELTVLYETALSEYKEHKEKLSAAEKTLNTAETEYRTRSEELTAVQKELDEAQSKSSSLSKEITSLNTDLSKAKSNITKLRSEYNSLSTSYSTDQLELKNKLDTDMASFENAEYHYQITCSTIEKELEEKQTAYDTAEENLRIFSETLSDGCINAKQDGVIYSLNYQEGRNVNVNMPYVYYVDESGFSTTVELDQNDVTQISIGDKAVIYSSETGIVNGKITAISEGTSTSLADVRFNVTVTADEGADLYVGQSVNVYFNYGDMKSGSFSDFTGSRSGDGERPDFGGSMPEGFDTSKMPDFSGGAPGGFDLSNMPDLSRRKDN